MVKIIAHYLPQFHGIHENHEWRGNDDCDDVDVLKRRAQLALEHGIYGFCFWHYWSKGKLLWEKPAESFFGERDLKLRFCFAWANESWTRTGDSQDRSVLIEQKYGKHDDWQSHFSYVAKFFEDNRYIKIANKPVFLILDSSHISECRHLLEAWNSLAVERGFPGIYFIQMLSRYPLDRRSLSFNAKLYFEPEYTLQHATGPFMNYDEIYQSILQRTPGHGVREIPGVFTDWDHSPRRSDAAEVYSRSTPVKFEEYLLQQIKNNLSRFDDSDMIFINAWNGWADGAYLEPDERYGTGYLEAVKHAKERSTSLDLPLFYRTIF